MSGEGLPLGRLEDLHLELKGKAALAAPASIGREVVAMLNAEGGEVWVGLGEEGERAIRVEPIDHPEREARALHAFLVDSIEPSPTGREVSVEVVPAGESGGAVLRVRVAPQPHRQPFALLKGGGRHFVIRVGARIRPMSREEILHLLGGAAKAESPDRAVAKLHERKDRAQQRGGSLFWLGIQPVERLAIDVQPERFERILRDPALTGNRRTGFHALRALGRQPRLGQERVSWGEPGYGSTEVTSDGGISFEAGLERFHWKGEDRELWPPVLLELPISVFRLAGYLYRELGDLAGDVLADCAFFGIRGWRLRDGSLDFLDPGDLREPTDLDDLIWEEPLRFAAHEISEEPDRCGFRLVRRVYEAFGIREAAIPSFFDRGSGRLILPE